MVPGARLCENGRFYRDGARAPHTSASNIDIGGAGVAISTQFGLWSLFSHATDPSSVVGMDIMGAGGLAIPVAGLCQVVVIFARNGMEFV